MATALLPLTFGLFALVVVAIEARTNGQKLDHPWLASIQRNQKHLCAGSIISKSTILTAASCLGKDQSIGNLTVRVGSSSSSQSGSLHRVVDAKQHESFGFYTSANEGDVAVIKVSPSIQFNGYVGKIALTRKAAAPDTVASSWGWKNELDNGELSDAELRIVECAQEIFFGQFCATPLNASVCQGDVGGPLVSNGVQVGILPRGSVCDRPFSPRVYNSIYHYQDWIEANSKKLERRSNEEIFSITDPWYGFFDSIYFHIF